MLIHDLWLALLGLRRNPVLSLLMIGAIAAGIAAAMIAITLYHARAGHPIPWKNDTLYAVTLDTRDAWSRQHHPEEPRFEMSMPLQLTLPDARALYASKIPLHAVMMYRAAQTVTPVREGLEPFAVSTRLATADFFATFDVPFLYGSGWTRADDESPGAVVVLSRSLNQKLFGGANSTGREVILDGHAYRVIGVLAAWLPRPRYYDLESGGGFDIPEEFMPFGWGEARRMLSNGQSTCNLAGADDPFERLLKGSCTFLQYWVELRSRADLPRFQSFIDSYTDEQRRHGRFKGPNNNRVIDVPEWLALHDVVGDDSRMQLTLGLVFLGVCVLNTLGLMLARSVAAAPVCGLRRALGASRIDIIRQQLVEIALVGLMGGAAGLGLTYGGLAVLKGVLFTHLRQETDNPDRAALIQSLVHMDATVWILALALPILTAVLVGLYPAWRAGRLAPATFLKAH